MTQKLHFFRVSCIDADDGRRITRWFPEGEEEDEIVHEGLIWERIRVQPREQTRIVPVIRESIRSVQLPKWWPYAKHHDATGACIFENETEAKEACKRAQDHGEPVSWDR